MIKLYGGQFAQFGMPLEWLSENRNWSCKSSGEPTITRWLGNPNIIGNPRHPPNGFACSTKQIIMLGIYYRFVALVTLIVIAKSHATGGGAVVEGPDGGKTAQSGLGKVVGTLFVVFMVMLTCFEFDQL